MEIKKTKRFEELNRKLTVDEEKELSESIKQQGVLEPLIVIKGSNVLVDGFNRERLATKHGKTYGIKEIEFESEDAAEIWAIQKQLGRRNLSTRDFKLLLGRLYNQSNRRRPGRPKKDDENFSSESEIIDGRQDFAEKHGVTPATVDSSSQLSKAHSKLTDEAKEVAEKLDEKQLKALSKKTDDEQRVISTAIQQGADPKQLIETRARKKVKPGTEGTSVGMLCDKITREHIAPMSKLIGQVAELNKGEGDAFKETREGMNQVIRGLGKMRKGLQ